MGTKILDTLHLGIDVQYHPGGQGHVYGRERKTPDPGYPNRDRYQAPPGHPNQQGWNPDHQPPPPPSQGGRSDGSADPYQDDPSDHPTPI